MLINGCEINSAEINGACEETIFFTGQTELTWEQRSLRGWGQSTLDWLHISYATGRTETPWEQRSLRGWGQSTLDWLQISFSRGATELPWQQLSLFGFGVSELPWEQQSLPYSGQTELLWEQVSLSRGQSALLWEQQSLPYRGQSELPWEQRSTSAGQTELPWRQVSLGAIPGSGHQQAAIIAVWRVTVTLGGVDISASITGVVRVEAEEDAARIAEFELLPAMGAIDPTAWVRQPVTIDYVETNSTGGARWGAPLFTGIVDVPEYDPVTRTVRFLCTDRLQESFEQSDAEAIDDAIGGQYSPYIFNPDAEGWQRVIDRLSTRPSSYNMDAAGIGRLTDWADVTSFGQYGDSGYIDGSVDLELANSRDMHNHVRILFEFRFQRLRQRDINRTWMMLPTVGCEFLQNPFDLPRRDMILRAAEATGWSVQSIIYVDLPKPRLFSCGRSDTGTIDLRLWGYKPGVNNASIANPDALLPFAQGAYIALSKRWAQSITEHYQIDIIAPQSIAQIGTIIREDFGAVEAEQETDSWELDTEYTAPENGATVYHNGDHVLDADTGLDDGRAAAEQAILTLQSIAKTSILSSHRKNSVSWRTLIQPQLELHHALGMNASGIAAQGKVRRLVHELSIDTGEATTEITLALSRSGAVGIPPTEDLEPPSAPDTNPREEDSEYTKPVSFSAGNSTMHIGGMTTSVPFSEEWTGLVTNYHWDPTILDRFSTDPDRPQTVLYPLQFRIEAPEIDEESRQAMEAQQVQVLNVAIPMDTLTIN